MYMKVADGNTFTARSLLLFNNRDCDYRENKINIAVIIEIRESLECLIRFEIG